MAFLGLSGLFVIAVGSLCITVVARSRDRSTVAKGPLGIALCASLVLIFVVTLRPADGPNDLQLVPLIRIIRGLRPPVDSAVVTNVVGNVVLFLPLGAAVCLLGLRRRATLLVGLCLSAAIELAQLFIPGRTTSADDVLCNTLGAFVGYLLVSRWAADRRPPQTP